MDTQYIIERLQTLLAIPSPTGFTASATEWLANEIRALGFEPITTVKGNVMVTIQGTTQGLSRLLASHVDTLGAMVREVKSNGRLKIVPIGGLPLVGAEGENVQVHTRSGRSVSGTIMPIKSSVHLFGNEVRKDERTIDNVEVRLDELVIDAQEVRALGIEVGDYISLDPRTRVTESGFIKSRFLDDKSCCALLLGILREIKDHPPLITTHFMFSNYEEVGHGIYGLPADLREIISVDIGVIGSSQTATYDKVTIFAKDGATPYDHVLTTQLVQLCQADDIAYNIDVIDQYASDASVAVRQGIDVRIACIGPGVESTHHYERTHLTSLDQTFKLLRAYLASDLK